MPDPCLRHPNTTTHQNGKKDADKSARRRGRFSRSSTRRIAAASGVTGDRTSASQGDGCHEGSQGGPSTPRPDPAKEHRGPGNGDLILAETGDGEETPNDSPKDNPPRSGDPVCCPGEALPWQPLEYPGGTNTTKGKRGSLAGAIPEALCWEAPKVQPMIRGETLEAVCAEAPKGLPWIHRRKSQRVSRPIWENK